MIQQGSHGAAIPFDDRGYLYGDGVFETVVALNGRLVFADLHRQRLSEGLRRLGLSADSGQLIDALRHAAEQRTGPTILRLTVTRGRGAGYAPPANGQVAWTITERELPGDALDPRTRLRVARSDIVLADQPLLAGIKHLNRLEQVMAAREALRNGVDDVLLCDPRGSLHSSSRANLFVLDGRVLFTAPCTRQGIAGTRRRLILESLAPAAGIDCREAPVAESQLRQADGAFLCNSVMGVCAIAEFDGHPLRQASRIDELKRHYQEAMLACVG